MSGADPVPFTPGETAALLSWSALGSRDLPWRGERDPWLVLVSEVMLQQTAAPRVVQRWPDFVRRWPTPASMAASTPAEVIAAWQGLGYNRRAVALHRCATVLVRRHGGVVPREPEALRDLPGVGDYTARAVAAFAFDADVGALDTNVGRALARRVGRPLGRSLAQRVADACVPPGDAARWNQALFDLGAVVCRKRSPDCGLCPVVDGCAWRGRGEDPAAGSAGVSRPQSPLEGSDRQGRARLVGALSRGVRVGVAEVAATMGWPADPGRAGRVLDGLVADGLVTVEDGEVGLGG